MEEHLGWTGILEAFSRPAHYSKRPGCPDNPKDGWKLAFRQKNLFLNTGYNTIADRLIGGRTYSSTTFNYFAWSDGATAPAITDTSTTFYADGSAWDTKAVLSVDSYDVAGKTLRWNCFLSSTDNAVATIRKFAITNADPGTVLFNELLLTSPLSKDSTNERYFRYNLIFSQV